MMGDDDRRPSPEAMLKLAQAEEAAGRAGQAEDLSRLRRRGRQDLRHAGGGPPAEAEGGTWLRRMWSPTAGPRPMPSWTAWRSSPRLQIDYQGVLLPELDIDAVLARKPQIALVDELAHTNAPGSRHEKRWQDVEELLAAGIDVYTTVNIQHFESLNDIVAQITGVVVRETVPDRLLDRGGRDPAGGHPPGRTAAAPAGGEGLYPRAGRPWRWRSSSGRAT